MEIMFNIQDGESRSQVTPQEIDDYASRYEIDVLIKDRYSALFIFSLMLLERKNGIGPFQVLEEIKYLEGVGLSQQTEPETQFTGQHLKGLWHKHFLLPHPSTIVHNIKNQLGKKGVEKLVQQLFDKEEHVTAEILSELSHRVVVEPFENRAAAEKLTGEWIIFAKENNQNYYLAICSHAEEDQSIVNKLKTICLAEFPFLSKFIS